MADANALVREGEYEIPAGQALAVSRSAAQRYETYARWYKNEDGLFSALGKFTGESSSASGDLAAVRFNHGEARLRSSVENLRNPVHRLVEFYATSILSGTLDEALPIKVDEDDELDEDLQEGGDQDAQAVREKRVKALVRGVKKIWEWSTLGQQKQVAKRFLALYGQFFIKIVQPTGKPYCYLQFVRPQHVTDFEADPRGNVVYIRLDVPDVVLDEGGQSRKIWRTEIWRKGRTNPDGTTEAGFALFADMPRATAGEVPTEAAVRREGKSHKLGEAGAYLFDFVPFVVVNAADTGEKRPDPVYAHGLHLISWICRESTRLSDLMFRFNKAFKVIFGAGNDATGRPMAPPKPGNVRDLGSVHRDQQAAAAGEHTVPFRGSRAAVLSREHEDISVEGVAVVGLSGNAQMADATPNINYTAAREWILDHLKEVYEELPELLFYAVEARANQSNAALRTLIAGAINRGQEMQSNLVTGLVKADKMALTIAQLAGLDGFGIDEIGTFEEGSFDHKIEPPEIMPLSDGEEEEVRTKKIANVAALVALGVPRERAFEIVGLDVGELGPELDDAGATDDVARTAQALARRTSTSSTASRPTPELPGSRG